MRSLCPKSRYIDDFSYCASLTCISRADDQWEVLDGGHANTVDTQKGTGNSGPSVQAILKNVRCLDCYSCIQFVSDTGSLSFVFFYSRTFTVAGEITWQSKCTFLSGVRLLLNVLIRLEVLECQTQTSRKTRTSQPIIQSESFADP